MMIATQVSPGAGPIRYSKLSTSTGPIEASQAHRLVPSSTTRKTPDDMTDEAMELVLTQAREGDRDALGLLYRRFSPSIYNYLRHRASDADLAADLTGTVFVRMLEAIRNGNTWHRSFTGWLYRIAHNVLIDHIRRVGRRPQTELVDCEARSDGLGLDEELERRQVAREVQAAIDELRPAYAQLLRLRFTDDLSQADIGRKMGKSEVAVKVTQHRALRVLRGHLEGRFALQAYVSDLCPRPEKTGRISKTATAS